MPLSSLTQADIDAVANLKVLVYVDGLFAGISDSTEHPLELNETSTPQGNAYSGENGAYLSVSQGSHTMFTPTVHGLNKNLLVKIDDEMFIQDGYYPLNATEPFTGRLSVQSHPDIKKMYPVVIKPLFVDQRTGTKWGSQKDNPLTILLPRASLVESITIPNNPNEVVKIQYTFRGHVDLLNDNEHSLIGAGIETDGTVDVQP